MADNHTLTLVISVFNDKYCDLYFFTPEQKKLCANLMSVKTFQMFVKNLMSYSLMRKIENPELNIMDPFRMYANSQFGRINDLNIKSYVDMPQMLNINPLFTVEDNKLDEVYVCDFRIGNNFYDSSDCVTESYKQRPKLYRADSLVCDDDCSFNFIEEDLDDLISTAKRCGDEVDSFNELSLYAVKDDRGIEICTFSIGNRDYFVKKARKHADNKNFLRHKTYVYEYKNNKPTIIYGCFKYREWENVVAIDLEKDNDLIIPKDKNYSITKDCCVDNKPFRTNHYELFIDDNDDLRLHCKNVDLSCTKESDKIIAKFYYTKKTSFYCNDDTDSFQLGSEHKINLKLHSPNADETHYLVEDDLFTLKEKRICLHNESDALCFEFIFARE